VLKLEAAQQTFTFTGVPVRPVPSLLRDFSAPVKMSVEGQSSEDLVFLFAHDTDPFNRCAAALGARSCGGAGLRGGCCCSGRAGVVARWRLRWAAASRRAPAPPCSQPSTHPNTSQHLPTLPNRHPRRWEAGQRLAKKLVLDLYAAAAAAAQGAAAAANTAERCAAAGGVPASLVAAYRAVLTASLDGAFTAMATGLPSPAELLDDLPGADPVLLHEVRGAARAGAVAPGLLAVAGGLLAGLQAAPLGPGLTTCRPSPHPHPNPHPTAARRCARS
jgi:hypothetical protein